MSNNGWPPAGQGHDDGRRPDGPSSTGRHGTVGGFRETWREEEFGHGQERYYGDLQQPVRRVPDPAQIEPGPGGGSGGASGRRTALIVAGASVAVGALGGGYALYSSMQDNDQVAGGNQTTSAPASPGAGPTSAASPTGSPTGKVQPVTPGWQVNVGNPSWVHAAYDVPPYSQQFTANGRSLPEWQVETDPTAGWGFGTGVEFAPNSAYSWLPSYFHKGFCATAPNAGTGFIGWEKSQVIDPVEAAPLKLDKYAQGAALKQNKITKGPIPAATTTQVKVNSGQTPAIQSRLTITRTDRDAKRCEGMKIDLIVTSFSTGKETATLVAVRYPDLPGAFTDADLAKILNTARPLP